MKIMQTKRYAEINRKTAETDIKLSLCLDGALNDATVSADDVGFDKKTLVKALVNSESDKINTYSKLINNLNDKSNKKDEIIDKCDGFIADEISGKLDGLKADEISGKPDGGSEKPFVSNKPDLDKAIDTGCGFLNHMLTLFAAHGGFELKVLCKGDTDVDFHHTTEDIGIALGQAFKTALGDKTGIARYADIILPMDEALVLCAVDISGRGYLNFDVPLPYAKVLDGEDEETVKKVGLFDTELVEEFFLAFVREAGITLHFKLLYGKNTHHIIEGVFKAFARVMKKAVEIIGGGVPSTKGLL